ncbi:aldo/keto reductase [Kaistia dalseonensis]|uniref:Aryl-alcohol dehydrogenase-like predicted oxidoreductase n=1 Tax=Kaistia dalseonensis TaxID=410840 RepID=A0ABU0H9K2_9HYPH|nr:aldo/keto reductase [Kaistia dalseonensis]MCX5495554.1 aldo/keto reductase [Kaistia dalseonensis]MDQ0438146.1 aryl-alcohol dehydrogenase-like predicted oxidoreductase [Kaistia dalseonensis]
MDYVNLGRSGLKVSRLCLGCMTYTIPGNSGHSWLLNEEQSRPFYKRALELGINFFDTANVYSAGASEEVLGRAIRDLANRDEVVIATKLYNPIRPGANAKGLSRKAIMTEIDASLKRLGTDYVDLYVIHRWDPTTPIEETLEALSDVVKAGKARYIGASSMFAWQFSKALQMSERYGWARFISMQNHMNLLYREEEREMIGLCASEGVGVTPWSPLARGRLARTTPETSRASSDQYANTLYAATEAADSAVVEKLREVSGKKDLPPAQVALAWLLQKPAIASPVIGATKLQHLDDAVAALSVKLSADEIAALEEPYIPHAIAGF